MKRGATRQELVVAAGVHIHAVAAGAERNFVVHQLHEASREPKMRLMADLMNPAKEEAVVAPHTRVLESLRAFLIHMNPEAASPHGHVDEPAEEEHEQQLLQAAAPVNLIKCPAAHRFTHEPYHDIHELHHDAHDIDTPGVPAAATGSPQQKAAAEVHHVSKAQQPRERCIRSMIPLRTKCSATRPRPAPRANPIELHESTTDPAEVAAMRRNIPAGCPVSTRDPLPGLTADIHIIVLSSSDDEEGKNKVEEASTRINMLQHDEISRLQRSSPLASRLNKSRRKSSLKLLLNCGTPNLSPEGSDYGSKDSTKVDPDWQYSCRRIESSAKRLKVQQHEDSLLEHTTVPSNLPIDEAPPAAKDDAATILAPPNITVAAAKPPSSNSASMDEEEEHDDGPASGAATLYRTYSRPKNAWRKSCVNYNSSSSYNMSSMSHDPAAGSSTRAARLPPYPYVREPSIPPLQHPLSVLRLLYSEDLLFHNPKKHFSTKSATAC
ncbi:unnamed protein product [Sphagnum jensenii]|uniref:Uncharacterized protein n=2 Tax=Sphagnum jensenii TaxID=128206 RepID=A0ABP0VSG7_9BRYO